MKSRKVFRPELAFTRLELVVLLAGLALLAAIAWPALAAARPRSMMVECLNNLRRVGQGFHVWANGHAEEFPWDGPPPEGGIARFDAAACFQVVSNEFGTPRFLVCPSDARTRASSFDYPFDNGNLSYFAGLHGNMRRPRSWLSGDRNLTGQESYSCSVAQGVGGTTLISRTTASAWDMIIHVRAGNLLLADGSVAQVTNRELTNYIEHAVAQDPEGLLHILKP